MKRLGFLALVIALCAPMFADETCDQALAEGKTLYKSGKYKQAKEMFDFVVSECGSSYGESASWSKKCTTALNAAKKTTTSAEKKSTATSTEKKTMTKETTRKESSVGYVISEANVGPSSNKIEYKRYFLSDSSYFYLKGDTTIQAEPGAEGYKLLRDYIEEKKQAKTGAISSLGKGVVIFGTNGISPNNIPTEFYDTILAINNRRETIIDVAMSNNMKYYCVIYEKNKCFTNCAALKKELAEFDEDKEELTSVSVNDSGDFAITSTKHYYCSNSSTLDFVKNIQKQEGYIYSINLSNRGVAVCVKNSVYFKKLPPDVYHVMRNMLNRTNPFKIKFVKFTDQGTCLITDGESQYAYRL